MRLSREKNSIIIAVYQVLCSVVWLFHKNLNLSLVLHPCRIDVNVAMPQTLSAFHMHAIVPVIQCIVNTVGQPQLCHSTLCLLREVSTLALLACHSFDSFACVSSLSKHDIRSWYTNTTTENKYYLFILCHRVGVLRTNVVLAMKLTQPRTSTTISSLV